MPSEKIALITNGANTEHFRFSAEGREQVRQQLGVGDKFVAMYAGIHGLAQGLEKVAEAARLLKDRDDIEFVFVGEGPRKAALVALKEEWGLSNLRLLPEVASERMPAVLSAADCTIVPLRDESVFYGALHPRCSRRGPASGPSC